MNNIPATASQSSTAAAARVYDEGPNGGCLPNRVPGPSITCGDSIGYKDRCQNLYKGEIYILDKREVVHTVIAP